jgi:hypothetical protein
VNLLPLSLKTTSEENRNRNPREECMLRTDIEWIKAQNESPGNLQYSELPRRYCFDGGQDWGGYEFCVYV